MKPGNQSDPGVPLFQYRDPGGSYGVRFCCTACMYSFDAPLQSVIDKLMARGKGSDRTGIKAVARLTTRPCPRCGAMRWETAPALGPRPSKTPHA